MRASTSLRVLIVDDDPHFTQFATTWLGMRGHVVAAIPSALGLVNQVASGAFDVVVLDCGLPALPGPRSLQLLAHNPRTARVPVLLVSAARSPLDDAPLAMHGRARVFLKTGRSAPFVAEVEATAQLGRAATAEAAAAAEEGAR